MIFPFAAFTTTLLALGTVSLQIFRGANINPAKILRTE